MLSALAFVLLAADPVARLDAFLKAHPNFTATVEVAVGDRTVGAGSLRILRPSRLRFDLKGAGFDYSLTSTPAQYLEIERSSKTYDERPSTGGFRMYDSRLSGVQALIPTFLFGTSAASMFGGAKPTVVGDGELKATAQTATGPVEMRLLVNAQGRPTQYSTKGGEGFHVWRIAAISESAPSQPSFALEPSLGYVPFALPEMPTPLQIGESVPLTGWHKAGRTVDLNEPSRGRPRLLAVLGEDCAPSRAARPFLIELGRTMPVFLIGKGEITDPSGGLMKRLSPPGTPMFYLVGMDGTVKKLWFGFDPAKATAWEAEVREAAK